MSPKPVRRRRPGAASRLRPFWFLLVLLLALVALGTYALVTWPALRPHAIDVSGNHVVSREAIVGAARVDMQTNLWLQNTRAIEQRIDAIPYVATARIHRIPPATMRIDVTEREPYAVIRVRGASIVVDRDLRALQEATPALRMLPVLEAPDLTAPQIGAFATKAPLPALRDDLVALEKAQIVPARLAHDRFGDAVATLRNGIQVLFGDESDLAKKIPLVDPILEQVARKGRPIAVLDLRAPSTPVVVYKK